MIVEESICLQLVKILCTLSASVLQPKSEVVRQYWGLDCRKTVDCILPHQKPEKKWGEMCRLRKQKKDRLVAKGFPFGLCGLEIEPKL